MGGCISTSLVDQDDSNRRLLSFAEDNNLDNQSYKNGNEIMQNEDEYDSVTILYDLYLNIKKWIIGKENANNRNLNNVGHEFCQKYHNVKSGFQSEVVQNTRFKIYKLPNIKNSCYMNSILQVLFSSKGINDRIRIYKSINMKENVNNMLETYLKLINTKDGIVACKHCLKDFRYLASQSNKRFADNTQEDAHEFLSVVLESLSKLLTINDFSDDNKSKSIEDIKNFTPIKKEGDASWKEDINNENSVITDYFRGQTVRIITCLKCRKVEYAFQSFLSFHLDIPENSERVTIKDCFNETTRLKEYSEECEYECMDCGKTSYSESEYFSILPKLLIIQLNRFNELRNNKVKNCKDVEFRDEEFDLSQYIHKDFMKDSIKAKYNLYGVSYHDGVLEGGHYTSSIKNLETTQWYLCDDDKVDEIKYPVSSGSSPYLLFFCRNDTY